MGFYTELKAQGRNNTINGEKMIGKKLKNLIKTTTHKQVDLAKHLGISPSRLSNYLSDKREPDLAMLAQMVKFLGSDLNTISGVDFGKVESYPEIETADYRVAEAQSAYGDDSANGVVRVQLVPMNAKKRGINSITIPVSRQLFDGVEKPEKNASVFQVNGYLPDDVAKENDYLVCTRCSSTVLTNGSRIFENGRNAKFFKYYQDRDVIILINENDNKEHVRIDSPSELNNYYKILWVIKKC